MTYQKFKDDLIQDLTPSFPEGSVFSLGRYIKNNDRVLDGLTLHIPDSNVSPTLYLDPFYEQLKSGKQYDDILSEILKSYRNNMIPDVRDFDFFNEFDLVSGRIIYRIVNLLKNKKMLKNICHIPYLDLAIIFCYLMDEKEYGLATIKITNEITEIWDVDTKTLMEHAVKNTPALLPPVIRPISDVISDFLSPEHLGLLKDVDINMYVLTNSAFCGGASCIIYKDLIKDFAKDIGYDILIIPSSLDEVLLLPITEDQDIPFETVREMIAEVNRECVSLENILSDHPYVYRRSEDRIICV